MQLDMLATICGAINGIPINVLRAALESDYDKRYKMTDIHNTIEYFREKKLVTVENNIVTITQLGIDVAYYEDL